MIDALVALPVASAAAPVELTPPKSDLLGREVERRVRRGWHVVAEAPDRVQLRKPKRFSFGWALLWFLAAVIPFVLYLLWYLGKKEQYVLLSVRDNGTVVASDRSGVWPIVQSCTYWANARPQGWQRALAFVAPIVIGIVVVGAVFNAASGSSGATQAAPAPSSSGTNATVPSSLSIGDTWHAVDDGWDITVNEVTTTGAFQGGIVGLPHVAHGVYLAVTVTMDNTGSGAHALGQNRFKLINDAGQSYNTSEFNRSYGNGSYGDDIGSGHDVNPGESLAGILFFDVPTNATGLSLKVIGGGVFSLGDVRAGQFGQ